MERFSDRRRGRSDVFPLNIVTFFDSFCNTSAYILVHLHCTCFYIPRPHPHPQYLHCVCVCLCLCSLKLQQFVRFKDTADALAATVSLIEGRLGKRMKNLLKGLASSGVAGQVWGADPKLCTVIKEKFDDLSCVTGGAVAELMRCVRMQFLHTLPVPGLALTDVQNMQLGLAHSLARYKLKFSPDKVDTMIVQAVCTLLLLTLLQSF